MDKAREWMKREVEEWINSPSEKFRDGFQQEKRKFIPSELYQYRHCKEFFDKDNKPEGKKHLISLENQKIWISSPVKFNDPSEGFFYFSDKSSSFLNKENQKIFYQDVFCSCLCERSDDFKMWSDFADSHQGFCVEYTPDSKINANAFYPIVYQDYKITLPIEWVQKNEKEKTLTMNLEHRIIPLSFKHTDYSQEKEWRIILPSYFDGRKEAVEKEGILISAIPNRIILGHSISEEDEEELWRIAEDLKIPVDKMNLYNQLIEYPRPKSLADLT